MIKRFAFISPLLIFLLTSFTRVIDPNLPTFQFYTSYYGPYDGSEGEVIMNFRYKYNGATPYTKVYELVEYRYNGMILTKSLTDYHDIAKNGEYDVSLSFPTGAFITKKFIDVSFKIISDTSLKILYSKIMTTYRMTPMEMNPIEDDKYYYESTYSIFDIPVGVMQNESFDFSLINDYFPNDEYYELDISNQTIVYNSIKNFTYKKASLCLYDTRNLFPRISKTSSGLIEFPLKIINNEGSLSFVFNASYYVEPYSLVLSSIPYTGYIKTSRLYLPLGRKDDAEGQKFFIKIEGAGLNKSSIQYELTYYSSNYLFGYCHNSQYCIKGGNNK